MFISILNILKMFKVDYVGFYTRRCVRFLYRNFTVECVYASRYDLNVYLDLGEKGRKNKKKLLKFITNTLTNTLII